MPSAPKISDSPTASRNSEAADANPVMNSRKKNGKSHPSSGIFSLAPDCRAEALLHPPFLENNFYLHFVGYTVSLSGTIRHALENDELIFVRRRGVAPYQRFEHLVVCRAHPFFAFGGFVGQAAVGFKGFLDGVGIERIGFPDRGCQHLHSGVVFFGVLSLGHLPHLL